MTIALVLADTPAYSETFFNSKIKGLQENGFRVMLYTRNRNNPFTLCPVIQAPDFSGTGFHKISVGVQILFRLLPEFKMVYRFIKLEKQSNRPAKTILKNLFLNSHLLTAKADWIHFGFATLAIGSENVAGATGAKMAVSFRGFDMNVYPLKNPGAYKLLWQRVNKVHSISAYLWKKAKTLGLSPKVSKQVITPAVVTEALPGEVPEPVPERIVTIARFNWIKGLDAALTALQKLKKAGIEAEYHVVGAGNREEEERIRFLAYLFGVNSQVVFHGKCSHEQTLQILKEATVYLQPSLNEGFCNAVLEAQALGIPCVVTNGGALPENVVEGETGWLVSPYDTEAMAYALQHALKTDKKQQQQMRINAINRVKNNYTIAQQKEQFVEFYSTP
jgi:colanic acid/amylovoran biosynthesis glycosyltransferase